VIQLEPVYSAEAEREVLGAMLTDPGLVMDQVVGKLTENDFFHPAHQKLYYALVQMYEKSIPIDPSTVLQYLTDRKILDECGGAHTVSELAASIMAAHLAATHIAAVRDKARIRTLVKACCETAVDLTERQHSPEDAINDAEMRLFQATDRPQEADGVGPKEGANEVIKRVLEVAKRGDGLMGFPTGLKSLDAKTGGIELSLTWYLAARSNVGKTNLALTMMLFQAQQGIPCGMITGDSPCVSMYRRLLSMVSGVALTKIRNADLSYDDEQLLSKAADTLDKLPLRFWHMPGLPLAQIRPTIRKATRKSGMKMWYIDYIQDVSIAGTKSKYEEVSKASRALKTLNGELNNAMVGLAQIGRGPEKTKSVPGLADLKESGQLEQDADFVMIIHRDRESDEPMAKYKKDGLLLPAKGRDIDASPMRIWINPATAHFTDVEPDWHRFTNKSIPYREND